MANKNQVNIGFIKIVKTVKPNGEVIYTETVDLRLMREVQELTDEYYKYYGFEKPCKESLESPD